MAAVSAKTLADQISQTFLAVGATHVDVAALQPADVLLDLYGEDIRGRAYVTDDPVNGEQMLRPDFTVPIVQMHMTEGAEPARYTYNGPVWRKQEPGMGRAKEYTQVGYEVFDRADPAGADAEVFATFYKILKSYNLRMAMGDVKLLSAAVEGLTTTPWRKLRLKRQIWRPTRFRTLLDWYSGKTDHPTARVHLLKDVENHEVEKLLAKAGPILGLRTNAEIAARISNLQDDAQTPPLPKHEAEALDTLLTLQGMASDILEKLKAIESQLQGLAQAIADLKQRLTAIADQGVDIDCLPFEASFGLTTLEYYDGFVFGFFDNEDNVIASGGRYDALTQVLGQGRSIPAVGGVIRPDALMAMTGRAQ